MEFASKSSLVINPGGNEGALNAIGTDNIVSESVGVGVLAGLKYLTATVRGVLILSASDSVTVNVRLTDGVNDYATEQVTIAAGTRKTFKMTGIDLTGVSGSAPLKLAVDVTSATGAATGTIHGVLDVETPLVISSGPY